MQNRSLKGQNRVSGEKRPWQSTRRVRKDMRRNYLVFAVAVAGSMAFCFRCPAPPPPATGVTNVNWQASSGLTLAPPVNVTDGSGNITAVGLPLGQTANGQVGATIQSASSDPSFTLTDSVNNNTAFAWTGYIVDLSMSTSFTLGSVSVSNPAGWTQSYAPSATFDPISGFYTNQIVFAGGTPVSTNPEDPNNVLDFSFLLTFSGSFGYQFIETLTPVPEPSVSLFLIGGLVFGGFAGRRMKAGKCR